MIAAVCCFDGQTGFWSEVLRLDLVGMERIKGDDESNGECIEWLTWRNITNKVLDKGLEDGQR